MKKTFAQVCCNLISNIFDKNNLEHKSKNNRILVRSANKKMLIDFNDMTLTFDDEENPRFRMKKFVKVSYNNMMEMRKRYENKLTELAKYILNDKKIDLRKQALHDIYNRELALLYINGKFYEGYTHAICLQQYLEEEKNNYVDSHERYREDEFEKYTSDKDIIAFAHKGKEEYKNYKDFKNDVITPAIFLETSTLQNISEEEATKLFNEHYNLPVYDDDSNDEEDSFLEEYKQLIAKRIDLRKKANHDYGNRESALLYINGKFYENSTHADCLQQYLDEGDEYIDVDTYYRNIEFRKYTDDKDVIAFAHKVTDEYKNYEDFKNDVKTPVIFLETKTLRNITKEEAAKLFNEHYNLPVYDDDSSNEPDFIEDYKQLIAKRIDLRKKADHDNYNRDYAILYVDGKVLTGNTHAECMNKYLNEKGIDLNNLYDRYQTVYRPELITDEFRNSVEEDDKDTQDMLNIYDSVKKYGFAHFADNCVFVEEFSLYNCTLEEVVNAIKKEDNFSDCKFYNDDVTDKNSDTGYELIAKRKDLRKKSSHDIYNRLEAILYINGEFISADTHANALNIYKEEHKIKIDNNEVKREKITKDFGKDDIVAFAHKVRDKKYELSNQENDYIFLETNSLQNISKEEAAQLFKQKFNLEVYDDDSNKDDEAYPSDYVKIASIKDFRKNKFRIQPRR